MLHIILDSPSSGHAITLFEASYNFKDIFQSGLLFEDINKMFNFIYEENLLKTHVVAIPTHLSLQEALELKKKLKSLDLSTVELCINNSYNRIPDINNEDPPAFLGQKLKIEQEVLANYEEEIIASLPHSTSLEYSGIIKDLGPHMKAFE